MQKFKIDELNDKSMDLHLWLLQYLSKKVLTLKLNNGFTSAREEVNEKTKYFDREKNSHLVLCSRTIDEMKDNVSHISFAMGGLRNYSSPLFSFYSKISKDKNITSLKMIDTDYIHNYTNENKLSSNYYVQLKSFFTFIDKNSIDDFKFNIGFRKDGTKITRPVAFTNDKTYSYVEPSIFTDFVKGIEDYNSNHPNPFVPKLLIKFLSFGGLKADEVQNIKNDAISFATIRKRKFMEIRVHEEKYVYIPIEFTSEDYHNYKKIKEEKNHSSKYLFYTRDFKIFSTKGIYDIAKRYFKKSGYNSDELNCSKLRHSMAASLHFDGVDSKIIDKLFGHSKKESIEFYIFSNSEK